MKLGIRYNRMFMDYNDLQGHVMESHDHNITFIFLVIIYLKF